MSSARARSVNDNQKLGSDQQLAILEKLVDELLRHSPCEERIRAFMADAGLDYIADPIDRMNNIMALLNGHRGRHRERLSEKS